MFFHLILQAPRSQSLAVGELLTLIMLATEHGYTVKAARDMKSLYDAVSSDLYAVWYAIENEVPLFAGNITELVKLTGWILKSNEYLRGLI